MNTGDESISMHFSIPDCQEHYDEDNGTSYTKFNIHINGNFHCCLRYKQLLALHEKIKNTKFLHNESLPTFPPKKLFPLTLSQLENRRLALERYIQFLGQDSSISKSDFLKNFFLRAQIESASVSHESTTLDVYLMNNFHIALECNTTDYSSKVLQNTCQQINVPNQYLQYFSLYFMRRESEKEVVLVRKLQDFESPYISKQSYEDCQIVIRKSYFDPCYDSILMQDKISLNLLFIQTVSDIEHNWVITTPAIKEKLSQLQERGNKKEYLELAKNLPSYDCIKFTNAIVDYPVEGSVATVIIGNRELRLRTLQKNKIQETKFIVTRIKCWRVSTIHNKDFEQNYELSMEYLMNKNNLKWVTIVSEHAIIISVCLQNLIDELIQQKNKSRTYDSNQQQHVRHDTTVYFRNATQSVHNDAFEGIGDDDL